MQPHRALALVLLALVVATVLFDQVRPFAPARSLFWKGFLYGIPTILAGLALLGQRWVSMAAVMYGTVGLALDISTLVQEMTYGAARAGGGSAVFWFSALTGTLNFLLIVIGGRAFLTVPADVTPLSDRPPNPPSHPA